MSYHPQDIYDATKAIDPKAVSPWNRACQISHMCRVLIAASDTSFNIPLTDSLSGQLEVMYQLADELRHYLEDAEPAADKAVSSSPVAHGHARSVSKMYETALRAEAVTRAAETLVYDRTNLAAADSPPVIHLLEIAVEVLQQLAADLSTLERDIEQ